MQASKVNFITLSLFFLVLNFSTFRPVNSYAFASNNIPLDSPLYSYFEKLSGFGLLKTDVRGLKPWSKAEAARLLLEAERLRSAGVGGSSNFADQLILRLRELLSREVALRENPEMLVDSFALNPATSIRLRTVFLDGVPRNYNRISLDYGGQRAFGFIGPILRPESTGSPVATSGTEGTPLLENNNGVIHTRGLSGELRWGTEGQFGRSATVFIEPSLLIAESDKFLRLNRGYLKIGGNGIEFEAGRDENWFGQGYRGTTTLTNNAKNFNIVKLSSAEPLDIPWIKNWLGNVKYTLIASRFDETDRATPENRHPWFLGTKLAIKPTDWFEIGANFVRQFGGPGFSSNSGIADQIFGGGQNDHSNTIAGVDLRFRFKDLHNTEFHFEFSGEDNAGGVWPIVESYVTGIYVPCINNSCRDDFRFEYFFGSVMLYGDWQFPRGYVYENMTPGHSQGGNAQEFFGRYSHWFSVRNNLAIEYFYTERSRNHRTGTQVMESKHAGRLFWSFPLYGDVDTQLGYSVENIDNLNLISGVSRTNQLISFELKYKY